MAVALALAAAALLQLGRERTAGYRIDVATVLERVQNPTVQKLAKILIAWSSSGVDGAIGKAVEQRTIAPLGAKTSKGWLDLSAYIPAGIIRDTQVVQPAAGQLVLWKTTKTGSDGSITPAIKVMRYFDECEGFLFFVDVTTVVLANSVNSVFSKSELETKPLCETWFVTIRPGNYISEAAKEQLERDPGRYLAFQKSDNSLRSRDGGVGASQALYVVLDHPDDTPPRLVSRTRELYYSMLPGERPRVNKQHLQAFKRIVAKHRGTAAVVALAVAMVLAKGVIPKKYQRLAVQLLRDQAPARRRRSTAAAARGIAGGPLPDGDAAP